MVLIIQNNIGNLYSPTVVVAALSGKVSEKTILPTHYKVRAYVGLKEESLVLLKQIWTLDKQRLCNYIGKLDNIDMGNVEECLATSLELKLA